MNSVETAKQMRDEAKRLRETADKLDAAANILAPKRGRPRQKKVAKKKAIA